MGKIITVLVVDDSPSMRKAINRMLEKDDDIKVIGTASNGQEAVEKVELLCPNVVTMDIEMPVMNGIEAVRYLMAHHPVPVIMLSVLSKEGADVTMEALDLGACDFVTKELTDTHAGLTRKQSELVSKVKDVAKDRVRFPLRRLGLNKRPITLDGERRIRRKVLSIGASTGGPPALQHILVSFPGKFPIPVVIAQHMPRLFTQSFAQRLNSLAQIEVKEAEDGESLRAGVALIAPGDCHLAIKKNGMGKVVELTKDAQYVYRPSVDLLMSSTASVFESQSIGVILTGMGTDGLAGLREMRAKEGFIIARAEETSVVYGMPKAVVNGNLADLELPIDKIPEEIIRML
jgi:two-component system, chemotaxis family, protein-glutamate methylesterase/glutaminase